MKTCRWILKVAQGALLPRLAMGPCQLLLPAANQSPQSSSDNSLQSRPPPPAPVTLTSGTCLWRLFSILLRFLLIGSEKMVCRQLGLGVRSGEAGQLPPRLGVTPMSVKWPQHQPASKRFDASPRSQRTH